MRKKNAPHGARGLYISCSRRRSCVPLLPQAAAQACVESQAPTSLRTDSQRGAARDAGKAIATADETDLGASVQCEWTKKYRYRSQCIVCRICTLPTLRH